MANNQLLASDNFASGSLAAGWSAISTFTLPQITSAPHYAEASAINTNSGVFWSGLTWPNDHISEFTVQSANGTGTFVLIVRCSPSVATFYQLNFTSGGGCALYRTVSGTATQIGTFSSQTALVGDIFTLQAAGSVISLYKNYKMVGWVADTGITSGSPGFTFFSTSAVTDAQISSWRGYSLVQQDGIWAKQAVAISPIAAEIATSQQGVQNPSIIQEANAKILSGTVYKMWFSSGGNGGAGSWNLGYAESLDGLSWTDYASNPVISAVGDTNCVLKVGSTYYCYSSYPGANVTRYTSTDGLSWASQGTVFTQATHNIAYFSVVAITGGTWYALYIYLDSDAFPLHTRLATSPDGVTWTDYASNPVVNNFWGVAKAFQVGSAWYAWGQTVNPNAQEATKPGIDPGEGMRMQTTDFIHWTNPVHSVHHSQMFEDVNGVNGGCYVSFPINVGGKAYVYYTASTDDDVVTAAAVYQIGVAVGPAPIVSILTANEDAVQSIAIDSFQRADGAMGASWSTPAGGTPLQIASHLVEPSTTGANDVAVYTGASFSANQTSDITIATLAASSFASPIVRASLTALTWYEAKIGGPTGSAFTTCQIFQRIAGVAVALGPQIQITPAVNDVFRLQVITGSDGFPTISLFQNGYMILQVQDQSATPISSGNPGVVLNAASAVTNSQISKWAGGNANVTPNYPSGGGAESFMQAFRNPWNKRGVRS